MSNMEKLQKIINYTKFLLSENVDFGGSAGEPYIFLPSEYFLEVFKDLEWSELKFNKVCESVVIAHLDFAGIDFRSAIMRTDFEEHANSKKQEAVA